MSSLYAIPTPSITRSEPASFCSRCGRPPAASGDQLSRVCARCDTGLVLCTRRELAPLPGDAFLIVDAELVICAVSEAAETLLGRSETSLIHRPLGEILLGVEGDARGDALLPGLARAAARGDTTLVETLVTPTGQAFAPLRVRLGFCGPPHAALLVIEGSLL